MKRDTKRIEQLLALAQESRKLVREEMAAGASLQHIYDDLGNHEQTFSVRLRELNGANAELQKKANERAKAPTLEKWEAAGYKAENYPPKGFEEVDSPRLQEYKAQIAAEKAAAEKAEAEAKAAADKAAADKAAADKAAADKAAADKAAADKAAADKAAADKPPKK